MTRWARPFPIVYEQSVAQLVVAEEELARLAELLAVYASQPNVPTIWQGYVDQKAGGVAEQRLLVERLRGVVLAQLQAKADMAATRV
jgi:hypothetical protein